MSDFQELKFTEDEMPSREELPGDLPEVAEIIGVPLTLKLAARFRGSTVYFHNTDSLLRTHRNNKIITEYEGGTTVPKIARKYRLSVRNI